MNLAALKAWAVAHKAVLAAGGAVGVVGVAVAKKKAGGSTSNAAPAGGVVASQFPTSANPATYDTTASDTASAFGDQLSAYQDWVSTQLDALAVAGAVPETPTQTTTTGASTGGTTTAAVTAAAPRPKPKPQKAKAIVHPVPVKKTPAKKTTPKKKAKRPATPSPIAHAANAVRKATPPKKPVHRGAPAKNQAPPRRGGGGGLKLIRMS